MAKNLKKIPKTQGNGGNKQEPIEVGSYEARVVQIIDLGLQPQKPYKGQEKPPCYMIRVTYELCDEFCLDEDGNEMEDKPRWISEKFPLKSLDSDLAKSTKRYNAIDPNDENDGNIFGLIGMPCVVSVGQYESQGVTKNEITNVSIISQKKAAKLPELVNEPVTFDLDEPDLEVFLSLFDWLQDDIKANLEFNGSKLDELLGGGKPKADNKAKPKGKAKPKAQEEEEADDEPPFEADEETNEDEEGWLDEE